MRCVERIKEKDEVTKPLCDYLYLINNSVQMLQPSALQQYVPVLVATSAPFTQKRKREQEIVRLTVK